MSSLLERLNERAAGSPTAANLSAMAAGNVINLMASLGIDVGASGCLKLDEVGANLSDSHRNAVLRFAETVRAQADAELARLLGEVV